MSLEAHKALQKCLRHKGTNEMRNMKVIVSNWSLLQNEYVTRSLLILFRLEITQISLYPPRGHIFLLQLEVFFPDGQIQKLTNMEGKLVICVIHKAKKKIIFLSCKNVDSWRKKLYTT